MKMKHILPLVLKACNTLRRIIFLQQISKLEKNHTGPFSKCLIVMSSKVIAIKRSKKKESNFGVPV